MMLVFLFLSCQVGVALTIDLCSALNIQAYVVKQVEENGWDRKEDIGRGE